MNSYPNGSVQVFTSLDAALANAAQIPGTTTLEVTGDEATIRRLARNATLGASVADKRRARRRQQAASRRANRK